MLVFLRARSDQTDIQLYMGAIQGTCFGSGIRTHFRKLGGWDLPTLQYIFFGVLQVFAILTFMCYFLTFFEFRICVVNLQLHIEVQNADS